jgi:hypothetical protein
MALQQRCCPVDQTAPLRTAKLYCKTMLMPVLNHRRYGCPVYAEAGSLIDTGVTMQASSVRAQTSKAPSKVVLGLLIWMRLLNNFGQCLHKHITGLDAQPKIAQVL